MLQPELRWALTCSQAANPELDWVPNSSARRFHVHVLVGSSPGPSRITSTPPGHLAAVYLVVSSTVIVTVSRRA